MTRTFAIGDIHGYLDALNGLLDIIRPNSGDTIVMLGDYVDRGPNSRGVIERLIQLESECHLVSILGNHDQMALDIANGDTSNFLNWLGFGGEMTLDSYDCASPADFPKEHIEFLRRCVPWHESEQNIFVHANYIRELPMDQQPAEVLRWDSLRYRLPGLHCSGKKAILGHTSQKNGLPLELDYLTCIDTWIYGEGYLTAMDVDSAQFWQVDQSGASREG